MNMQATVGRGLDVCVFQGAPEGDRSAGFEVDVGSSVPQAFAGLRQLLRALHAAAPAVVSRRAAYAPEWNVLFPDDRVAGRDLTEIADAPNQRRLFRESAQIFRVLNAAAHLVLDGVEALGRPLILRNVGACDLVSLRGILHTVQVSRLTAVRQRLVLADWATAPRHVATAFAATREAMRARALERLRIEVQPGIAAATPRRLTLDAPTLEGAYLQRVLDPNASCEVRLAAALLAIRACFFSTNYEGAMLAAEVGLQRLDAAPGGVNAEALAAAWGELDDPRFDIPMIELDRASLGDAAHLRAQLLLHTGIVHVFTGRVPQGIAAFGAALACDVSPETASDLRLYRALAMTKSLGQLEPARDEIAAGLAALAGRPRATAGTSEAWLLNLLALTYVQEKKLDEAQRAEERSLACIDGLPGPSATHLKTNLVSNFSVLYESRGDLPMATRIWQSFAALNATLGSDAADKVYLNRLGALQRAAGDADAAIASYRGAFDKAEATGDAFHAETIAGAIARVHLDRGGGGDRQAAAAWFGVAAAHAHACGDCLQLARNLAGAALASGTHDFAAARAALAGDLAYGRESAALAAALAGDVATDVLALLPAGKSKLSRPFTLVNLG